MLRLTRETVEVVDDPPLPNLWQMRDLQARGYGVSVTAGRSHCGCVVWDDCGRCCVDVDAATPEAALQEAWRRMAGC